MTYVDGRWHSNCNICDKQTAQPLAAAKELQGGGMLRVEIEDSRNTLTLKLEGRFTGGDAENTRTLAARCGNGTKLIVDLTEVTFIDDVGENVLSFLGRFGAEFVAQTSYTLDICERLRLRLAQDGGPDESASHTKLGERSAHSRRRENDPA